jgi:hypothetical protein
MKVWILGLVWICQMAGLRATAQDPASASASSQATDAEKAPAAAGDKKPADKAKPKKVWTNEEVGSLPGTVSVVGSNRPAERETESSESVRDPRRGKILRYRAAIAELRKKIEAADQRIAQYKNFKGDDSSPNGGINPGKGYTMVPLDEQVKQLEEKKKQWLGNIEDLENQAKKEGIEPGELR